MAFCERYEDRLTYYNITLQILSCSCVLENKEDEESLDFREKYLSSQHHEFQPVFETSLLSRIQNFFEKPAAESASHSERQVDVKDKLGDSCHAVRNYTLILNSDVLSKSTFVYLVSGAIAILILLWMFWYILHKFHRRKSSGTESEMIKEDKNEGKIVVENLQSHVFQELGAKSTQEQTKETDSSTLSHKEDNVSVIKLCYQLNIESRSAISTNTADILNGTVDKLYQKLDKMLISSTSPGPSIVAAVNATPRLARRSIHGRRRMGSSPSLQLYDNGAESLPTTPSHAGCPPEWKLFKQFCAKMNWKQPISPKTSDVNYDQNVQTLLRYFERVCPISDDIWNSATLITNYAILLLQTELNQLVTTKGYRCVDLVRSGSCMEGYKVGKANQYDMLMVLQPPVLPSRVINIDKHGKIPAGHILINTQTDTPPSRLVKQGVICKVDLPNAESPYFLSASEFYYAAEEMIETCLQTLYTKVRLQMDRLPFKISKSNTTRLSVTLDTRNIVGLGLPDIRISLYPVMYLPADGWFTSIPVYAAPVIPDDHHEAGMTRKPAISSDALWTVNFNAVYSTYLSSIDMKMKHAGVRSCHTILIMILKSLFTGCNTNNLLDRGELQTKHITHVMNFLLLESSPQNWTFDLLADRFSDVVHFLRDAFSNERLPNFFLNNPHLSKKVPFVANNPLFASNRQHNILSDVPNKTKCLEYIEKCVRESGLKGCVKEGYSPDMWEYEFFVY